MPLDKYMGDILLTHEEKAYRLGNLQEAVKEGEIDEEMLPYLDRINALHWVCTTQCCTGHNGPERTPHVDIRVSVPFSQLFSTMRPLMVQDRMNVRMQVYGWGTCLPRFCFGFEHESWREATRDLIDCLEDLEEELLRVV